jgi:hypothetical protein
MSDRNTMRVPEITAYARRGGVTAYAVREPGERQWRGHACRDGSCLATAATYADPATAASRAGALLGMPEETIPTGDFLVDALILGRRMG